MSQKRPESKRWVRSEDPTAHYLQSISAIRPLSREQERALMEKAQASDQQAFTQLIEGHLQLVVKIAKSYQGRGIDLLDLIEEGNLGLMHAVKKFDLDTGFRFSTYASWWVRQYIEHIIMQQNRVVRLPVHVIKKLSTCYRTGQALAQKIGYEPSVEEIAKVMGEPVSKVNALLNTNRSTQSIDQGRHEDEQSSHEIIESDALDNPEDLSHLLFLNQQLNQALDRLEPTMQTMIIKRYGLRGESAHTLQKLADESQCGRDQVRMTCQKGLKQLATYLRGSQINLHDILGASDHSKDGHH